MQYFQVIPKWLFSIALTAIIFFPFKLKAQEVEYGDLLVLYVGEEYEKCLKKSLKYTEKDKTKKHPLPYLYASMAYFEMSRDHAFHSDYPKAFRRALSYAAKYRKKDKYFAYRDDSEAHLEKLKLTLAEEIENYQLDGSEKANRKIVSSLKKLAKLDPEDSGITILRGLYEIKNKNRTEGRKYLSDGIDKIEADYSDTHFELLSESQQLFFKMALIEAGKFYKPKDLVKAREIIRLGEPFFLGNNEDCVLENVDDFKEVFEEVVG